jgi:hypothetical protein
LVESMPFEAAAGYLKAPSARQRRSAASRASIRLHARRHATRFGRQHGLMAGTHIVSQASGPLNLLFGQGRPHLVALVCARDAGLAVMLLSKASA